MRIMGPVAQSLESLKACFDVRGAVDTGALAASPDHGRLGEALAGLAEFDPRRMRIPAQLAFWLNVYNAAVVRDLLEFDGGELFARPRLRIAGHAWSLDDIEQGMLRGSLRKRDPRLALAPVTFDERAYFALYRACRSSLTSLNISSPPSAELIMNSPNHSSRVMRIAASVLRVITPSSTHTQ